MPIVPVTFNAGNNTVTVWHTAERGRGGHGGTVTVASLLAGMTADGNVVITCPQCGDTSVHPPGGGSDALRVQRLILRLIIRKFPNLTWAQAKNLLRQRIEDGDGLERFLLTDANSEADL